LCTAQAAEAPLVLLSGHPSLSELGRGSFQELRQADMAEPVTKASWTAESAETLAFDIAEAVRLALAGRRGPVHLSLPIDLLEQSVADAPRLWPGADDFAPQVQPLSDLAADAVLAALAAAKRPLILGGPMLCHAPASALMARLAAAAGVPAIGMESPRGINDPSLGAFAEVLSRADLIVLIGKPHDFTIRFGDAPFVDPNCRFVVIDPEPGMAARAVREKGPRCVLTVVADAPAAAERLIERAAGERHGNGAWTDEVRRATAYRPAEWDTLTGSNGRVHPVELCRGIQQVLEHQPRAALVCDGGEIGQWAQSLLTAPRRVINGVAGSIGAAIPFALAARAADLQAPVIAVMGDGAFGFHMTEFDTALRYGLPLVVVIGNDATWNAEYQIQLRTYGRERAHGCELLPTRYDRVVEALGGHGEFVESAAKLGPALKRALASGKPACVNVRIERVPAPLVRCPT
jgi:acetolactate synthase-1/2/3 large subunit